LYGAGAMIVIGGVFQSRPLFALGLVLVMALAVSWLWSRWCLQTLTVDRRFRQPRAFWGEEVDMAAVFTNAKPLPVPWLAVEDEFPGVLDVVSSSATYLVAARRKLLYSSVSLGWYERVTRHYKIKCRARGEHDFGP